MAMGRYLLALAVAAADVALFAALRHTGLPLHLFAAYAAATISVVALAPGFARSSFAAALALAPLTGGSFGALLWTAYHAGRAAASRSRMAALVAMALGGLAAQLAAATAHSRPAVGALPAFAVFVAVPLLVGRYVAQHERLVAALDEHNRQLRRERDLLAEQERMRERLRIARDMHDSLGRRLSLVSLQAAALEVSASASADRTTVRRLATSAREALDELHELVGALRAADEASAESAPGIEALDELVAQFEASGVAVELRRHGEQRPVSAAVGQAAFRVVEEGLTNAAKHASGRPVAVAVAWESDALLVTVTNPVTDSPWTDDPAAPGRDGLAGAGHGLRGLGERARLAGGFLDHGRSTEGFRLFAMLPVAAGPRAGSGQPQAPARRRITALKLATLISVLVLLPAGMLLGAH
jgi:signal transduction histidine kinase